MQLKKRTCLIFVCFCLMTGCGGPMKDSDKLGNSEAEIVEQTKEVFNDVKESDISTHTIAKSAVTKTEIEGLEEGIRIWYLMCDGGENPLEVFMAEEGHSYGGGGGMNSKGVSYQEYTMYTLKQYLIGLKDNRAKETKFQVKAHFEENGLLILEFTKVKTDSLQDQTKEVNLLIETEQPMYEITILLDEEEVCHIGTPYFATPD